MISQILRPCIENEIFKEKRLVFLDMLDADENENENERE